MSPLDQHNDATEAEEVDGKVVPSKKPKSDDPSSEKINVRRGRVDSINIYEISDSELNTIERGSTNSIFLNFSIFLLSTAVSLLVALLTANFDEKPIVQNSFLFFTIVGFLGGIFLLILWYRFRDDFKSAIQDIKNRMEDDESAT